MSDHYPELDQFFGAYLNQDYDLSGETIEEVVKCYKQGTSAEHRQRLAEEVGRFVEDHSDDLDAFFSARYGYDFDPALWGYTTASFFERLKQQLAL